MAGAASSNTVLGAHLEDEPEETDEAQLERQILEAWKKCNLLALDGGGIRGYWSLLALNKLMECIAEIEEAHEQPHGHSFQPLGYPQHVSHVLTDEERLKIEQLRSHEEEYTALWRQKCYLPCHYFDYIGGTSTGGLIAIMLGRLRMTVPDCLAEYEALGAKIFGKPRMLHELNFPIINRTKYDAENLRKIFEDVAKRRGERTSETAMPRFPSKTRTCRCFVTAFRTIVDKNGNRNRSSPYLIRSYKCDGPRSPLNSRMGTLRLSTRTNTNQSSHASRPHERRTPRTTINRGNAQNFEIWQVARAATAARYFFDPIEIRNEENDKKDIFEDGGLGTTTNPTKLGISDIEMRGGPDSVGVVVSVGTARGELGRQKEKWFARAKQKAWETVAMASDPEAEHYDVLQRSEGDNGFAYYRFNPPPEGSNDQFLDMPMDEWEPSKGGTAGSKTIKTILDAFNSWLRDTQVHDDFRACAKQLVERRRLRIQNQLEWERYAMAMEYNCGHTYCPRQDRTWTDGFEFDQHLRKDHHFQEHEVDREKQHAASSWQYRKKSDVVQAPKRSRRWHLFQR